MKNPKLVLKIATLSGFVLLTGSFVAFKAGVFKEQLPSMLTTPVDSPEVKTVTIDSFMLNETMSSSKSAGWVLEPQDFSPARGKDSTKNKKVVPAKQNNSNSNNASPTSNSSNKKDTAKIKPVHIMPSSKSGKIL
ncbi:MAG: hypothetical protein IAF38_01140 [Bacteroidia bacterium]|nr:hypothetical protein [Bacteroidia bacterium]